MIPRFSDLLPRGMKPGLETITRLLEKLGHPERGLKYIHVAGTNGKGATCAILDSILRAAGFKTARYTSPHLISLAERFFIDGAPVSKSILEEASQEVFRAIPDGCEPTFFESLTAAAFMIFAKAKPDVVLLETGLGGRLDATNAIAPQDLVLAIITRIGLDHCAILGNTIPAIAAEKAGIAKPGRPLLLGAMPDEARETIAAIAVAAGADVHIAPEDVPVPQPFALAGAFQLENARTALAAIRLAFPGVGEEAIRKGLASVVWPGRFQKVAKDGARFIIDGAHNPPAARALAAALAAEGGGPYALVAGFCGDKDMAGHLEIMRTAASTVWAVPIRNDRSATPETVAETMQRANFESPRACRTLAEALGAAAAWSRSTGGTVVVCGSLFLAAEALAALGAFPWPVSPPDPNEALRSIG